MLSWKDYLNLHQKKFRKARQLFIVEGARFCREALLSGWGIEAAYLTVDFQKNPAYPEFRAFFKKQNIEPVILNNADFKRLADTRHPQGILLIVQMPQHTTDLNDLIRGKQFILILAGVRDPGNFGTLIRSADWFGIDLVLTSPDSVEIYNPKVLRATMGSVFKIPVFETENLTELIRLLNRKGFRILGADVNAPTVLQTIRAKPPMAVILGGEAFGLKSVSDEPAIETIRVPGYGQAESLNVAVAGGIILNHLASIIRASNI